MQHPDEGTIHAWLDGELPEDQANEIAAHARDCPECSAKIAEARGLIAASTRILTALDNVPSGVIPETAGAGGTIAQARGRRRWYDRLDIRAAAALLVVAGASYLVVKRDSRESRPMAAVAYKVGPAPTPAVADKIEASSAPAAANAAVVPHVAAHAAPPVAAPVAPPVAMQRAAQPQLQAPERRATPLAAPAITTAKRSREMTQPMAMGGVAGGSSANALDAVAAPRADSRALGVVEGRVIDRNSNQGVGAAQVIIQGASLMAVTDKDGRFSITNVPAGEQHFIVRRIGYQAQNISITVPDDASVTADIALEQQSVSLSQVVTTGMAAVSAGSSLPRAISVDSTTARHRTVYEVSPGVRVTLLDTIEEAAQEKAAFGQLNGRIAGVAQQPASESDEKASIHTISWTDHGHRYELSGPVSVQTLESLKQRLMAAKR